MAAAFTATAAELPSPDSFGDSLELSTEERQRFTALRSELDLLAPADRSFCRDAFVRALQQSTPNQARSLWKLADALWPVAEQLALARAASLVAGNNIVFLSFGKRLARDRSPPADLATVLGALRMQLPRSAVIGGYLEGGSDLDPDTAAVLLENAGTDVQATQIRERMTARGSH